MLIVRSITSTNSRGLDILKYIVHCWSVESSRSVGGQQCVLWRVADLGVDSVHKESISTQVLIGHFRLITILFYLTSLSYYMVHIGFFRIFMLKINKNGSSTRVSNPFYIWNNVSDNYICVHTYIYIYIFIY